MIRMKGMTLLLGKAFISRTTNLSYMQNYTEKLYEYLQLVEASLLNLHKADGRLELVLSSPQIGWIFSLNSITIANQVRSDNLLIQVNHYCAWNRWLCSYKFHIMIWGINARNMFREMITPIRAHRTGISKAFLCQTVDRHTATVDQESPGMQLKWKKRDSLIYHSAVQTSEVHAVTTNKPVELSSLPYSQNQTPQDYTHWVSFSLYQWEVGCRRNSVYKPTPATRYVLGQILQSIWHGGSEQGRLTKSFGDKGTNVLEEENHDLYKTSSKGAQKKEVKAWNAPSSQLTGPSLLHCICFVPCSAVGCFEDR